MSDFSRRHFLHLAGSLSGAALLSACGGVTGRAVPIATSKSLDQLMYSAGVAAIKEKSGAVVFRSDYVNVRGFRSFVLQPPTTGGGSPSPDCSSDPNSCQVGDTLDGLKVIGGAENSRIYSTSSATYTSVAMEWTSPPPSVSAYYGPIYHVPKINWVCVSSSFIAVSRGLVQIAQTIAKNVSAYGAAGTAALDFLSGTIEAAEFVAALMAALGSAELLAFLAGVGLTVGSIAILAYCSFPH